MEIEKEFKEILKLSCSPDLHYKTAMAIKLKEKLYKERIKQLKEQLLYTKVAYDAVLEYGEEGVDTVKKLKLLDKYEDIVSDKWIDIDNSKQNELYDVEFKRETLQSIIN